MLEPGKVAVPTTLGNVHSVQVEAPTGAAALDLERRLFELMPAAVYREQHWRVDLPVVRSLEGLESIIRDWLSDVGASQTTLRIDGRRLETIHLRTPPTHRSPHHDFIG